ncbi:hypothetical protein [Rhizobacter sp. Root404]|jgi:hypothetical protein|uniref:hypothetical protein n=1 Tax=Rhizobacter sp. Root404 TaxID=1736528 RepID=UPI0006F8202A|nr:hypothetical protein [Rhizobacter sp. Root404]KQW39193.1 ribonucleotide reductase subunit alpha [Rhizobacter sp. Root404]
MTLSTFDDLLRAARAQAEPQRLLLVLATAGLPDDATPDERLRFDAGEGGTLTPLACIDKRPDELASFEVLCNESRELGQAWDIVFVGALAGTDDTGPSSLQAEAPLQRMIESIKSGRIDGFAAFDAAGESVRFT